MPDTAAALQTLGALYDGKATTFRVWAPDHDLIEVALETSGRLKAAPTNSETHELVGAGPPELVGAAPSELVGATPSELVGTTPSELVGATPSELVGATPSELVGATPSELVGAAFRRPDVRALTRDDHGYWFGRFEDVEPGARYRYRIDGNPARVFPDPASRFQPDGVHGVSEVVDASAFRWSDQAWRPPAFDRLVFYELHVGTFTPEGTFRAAAKKLSYLKELGVTAVELMPVADFPGDRNWGYDGVALFAPARRYGRPDDLRALVDAAHALGLAVFLDVVYNHFGPDGAYANVLCNRYFTARHRTPWGDGVNLDDRGSGDVRRFFIENALSWIQDFHVDGLRLDATHALVDDSATHFLAELASVIREYAPRTHLVAEDHRNLASLAHPLGAGGMGFDAIWADDFHHQARVHTAGDREGYYAHYSGTIDDLAETLRRGWFRGGDPPDLHPRQFVICIQNHDQVGNRANGARLHHEIDPARYRALTTLLLLAPQTPLLFMGQEWAASTPFLFFTDHHGDLGRMVTAGRREEFSPFTAFADPARRESIPDPQQHETFERSRLNWGEARRAPHAGILQLNRHLLAIRQRHTAWHERSRGEWRVDVLDAHTLSLTYNQEGWLVVARLSGDAGTVRLPSRPRQVVLTTEDAAVVSDPRPLRLDGNEIRFERPGALVCSE